MFLLYSLSASNFRVFVSTQTKKLFRQERWPVNITMSFLNSFLAQLSVAAVPVMAALYVTENIDDWSFWIWRSESSVELHHLRSSHLFPT